MVQNLHISITLHAANGRKDLLYFILQLSYAVHVGQFLQHASGQARKSVRFTSAESPV